MEDIAPDLAGDRSARVRDRAREAIPRPAHQPPAAPPGRLAFLLDHLFEHQRPAPVDMAAAAIAHAMAARQHDPDPALARGPADEELLVGKRRSGRGGRLSEEEQAGERGEGHGAWGRFRWRRKRWCRRLERRL